MFAKAIRLLALLTLFTGLMPEPSQAFFLRGGVAAGGGGSTNLTFPTVPAGGALYAVVQQQGYSGNAVQARRASDGATQDIGFASGLMDTSALDTFCASTTCTFPKWYDQSGNGCDAPQATVANQPMYAPGAKVRGKQGLTWFSSTARFDLPSCVTASRQNVTVLTVDAAQATADTSTILGLDTTSANRFALANRSAGTTLYNNSAFVNSTWMANSQTQFKAVTSSATETRIYLNGRQSSALATSTNVTMTGGYIGRTDTGGYTYFGNMFVVAIYPSVFTQAQLNTEAAKLYTLFDISASNTKRVLFEGDSITWGQGSSIGVGYPQRTEALITGQRIDVQNSGVPGKRMSVINGGKAFTLVYSYRSDYAKNVVHIFAGTNDLTLDGATASTTYTNQLLPYVAQAISTGYSAVVVGTMMPRTDCTGACETERVAYNSAITGGATANGYTVADYAADSRLQNPNNTTYFATDKIHLNDAGYDVMASIAAAAITPKLAANDNPSPNLYAANDNSPLAILRKRFRKAA